MDFLGILIFFVAVVASLAQKAQENKKAKKNTEHRLNARDERVALSKQQGDTVRQARPKGSAKPAVKASPETTGGDLIKALFGEEALDTVEGWTAAEPAPRRELPQHKPTPVPPQRHEESSGVREAAMRQREQMERARSDHPAKAHHPDKHRREHEQRQEQQSREQVLAERNRRKEEARRHREQAAALQKQQIQQQRRPRRAIAPVARSTAAFIPKSLDDVRRAIVFTEILGPPKAYDDR